MTRQKISLMDAYLIETLRYHGVTDQEILAQSRSKDFTSWKQLNDNFDFSLLGILYDQHRAVFSSIITEGYTIKFVTLGGLKHLLHLKFKKEENIDFLLGKHGVTSLVVSPSELDMLQSILSENWHIYAKEENSHTCVVDILAE